MRKISTSKRKGREQRLNINYNWDGASIQAFLRLYAHNWKQWSQYRLLISVNMNLDFET